MTTLNWSFSFMEMDFVIMDESNNIEEKFSSIPVNAFLDNHGRIVYVPKSRLTK